MFYANHLKNKILIKFKNVMEKLKLLIFKEINYKLQLKFLKFNPYNYNIIYVYVKNGKL